MKEVKVFSMVEMDCGHPIRLDMKVWSMKGGIGVYMDFLDFSGDSLALIAAVVA